MAKAKIASHDRPDFTAAHQDFTEGTWSQKVDVRNFIQTNYQEHIGDSSFLTDPTPRTEKILGQISELMQKERENGGVLDIDTDTASTITSHAPGYIDKDNELIVGLQTDAPLKRAIKPRGGIRLVERACESYGFKVNPKISEIYSKHARTHNDGVFSIYKNWDEFLTPEGKMLRSTGIITGLPDNYGRGRIIGDYRRVALYGIDFLIQQKRAHQKENLTTFDGEGIRARQEVSMQIQALKEMKKMADSYGFDISKPAQNFKEALQWTYFAYLAAIKEQDGAAMSMGRLDAFLDIYAERDLKNGTTTESDIQESIDDFVLKLRLVKHLRVPEYNELFAGDPTWVTCVMAGMGTDNRTLVTKTSFRLLHTLNNLGAAPEPNLTILWSEKLPNGFKDFASEVSIQSSSIQFESDDLMRPEFGDDYGIACCVSGMAIGKQMQFFGARVNLPKLLLMAINEGRNELDNSVILDGVPSLKNAETLDFEEVKYRFFNLMQWLSKQYVEVMNVIHYMHDHYNYENSQMALHDTEVKRSMAFGIAGISIVADSLSAIKHAKVTAIRNEEGVATDFKIEGDYPTYGSDDDSVDDLAVECVKEFFENLQKHKTYRDAKHTLSLLTITANVVYGKKTGATPDGRNCHKPFAPGANPMHNRDRHGAIASLNSVAKIPYAYCLDGISNTFSMSPGSLGKNMDQRINNLKGILDGYFTKGGHHLNVNVLERATLQDAMKHPEKYPNLTIRVSGYAVRFIALNEEQQLEVISRTFHDRL